MPAPTVPSLFFLPKVKKARKLCLSSEVYILQEQVKMGSLLWIVLSLGIPEGFSAPPFQVAAMIWSSKRGLEIWRVSR